MRFPRLRTILYGLLVLGITVVAALFLLLQSDFFWQQWVGPRLVKMINAEIRGTLTVGHITGNPFTAYVFRNLEITDLQGRIFQARELEIGISFASLLVLRPSIRLKLVKPDLALQKEAQGHWNATQLLRPRPKQPPSFIWRFISAVHLSPLLIKDGQVTVSQPGETRRFSNLDLDLEATLCQPFTSSQSIEVKKIALEAATPWGPYQLTGQSLTFGPDLLQMTSLVLESRGQRLLSLSGAVPVKGEEKNLEIAGILGPVPGKMVHFFWAGWPPGWETSGKLRVAGSLSKVKVNFQGQVDQAAFTLEGTVSRAQGTWNYDLSSQVTDVPPKMLAVLAPSRAKEFEPASPLSAQLQLQGLGLSWPPRQFAWNLRLKPLTYRQAKVEQAQISVAGTDQQQRMAGVFRGNFGLISLEAQGSFFQAPQATLAMEVKEFKPALFGLNVPQGSLLTGKFSGKVAVPNLAQPGQLSITGEVQATGRLGVHPLKELQARFTWEKPRLTIQGRAQVGNLLAEAQGTMVGNELNFRSRGRTLSGGNWPVPAALGGSLSWEGTVSGRWPEPAYTFRLNGQALSWGKVSLKSLTVRAQGQGLPPRTGTVDLKASGVQTPTGTFSQVNFTGQGISARWQFNFKASSPAKGPQAEMVGTADFGTRPLSLALTRLRFQGHGLDLQNQGPVQVRFLPGLALAPATFRVNGGTIAAQANLQNNQISSLLTVNNLPLTILRVKGLQGKIQARLTLSGTAANPLMESQIRIVSGKWRGFAFQSVQTTLNYSKASLTFTGSLQESQQKASLSWNGRLPARFSLSPLQFTFLDEDMEIKLTGASNLAVVALFTTEVQKANAPLNIQAEVSGRWANPRITGELRWGNGEITLSQAGTPYQLLAGSLRWENNRITLPELTLKSEGTANLTADISLAGLKPQKVTARAQFNNFKVLDQLASTAYVDGTLNLTGPWSALDLEGQLTIPRATLNPDLFKQSSTALPADYVLVGTKVPSKKSGEIPVPSAYRNMKIAIGLKAPNNVKVINKMANTEVAVDLQIKKNPGAPLLVGGVINSLNGKIDVYGKEFVLERGLVTFPGVPHQEPYLQALAVYKMTDARFNVNVSGTVKNPQVNLTSTPAMPPNEMMSYIIFGRPSSTLNQKEFDVTQQAVGVLGGITASKIQQFLGKDFPILGGVSIKGGAGSIGVTKPLTKGVALSVERNLNPTAIDNPVQLRLKYRINRYFSLEGEGGQVNTGADAIFNYEW